MSSKPQKSPNRLISVGLANFKAFGRHPQTIALRPITLIFGPNSGGKSSLLHFFLWMKDLVEKNQLDVYCPSASGNSVDLGGFRQLRHGDDPQTQVHTEITLQVRGDMAPASAADNRTVDVRSWFATCPPPMDHAEKLRDLVRKRLEESLSRNSLDTLISRLPILTEQILSDTLTKLLASEYGESRLQLHIKDVLEEREERMSPLSKLMEKSASKLHSHWKRQHDAIYRLLDCSPLVGSEEATVREDPPAAEFAPEELLLELQNLACCVLEELDHRSASVPEHRPVLVRCEITSDGRSVFNATRNQEGQFILESLDLEFLTQFVGVAAEPWKLAKWTQVIEARSPLIVFDEKSGWIPKGIRIVGLQNLSDAEQMGLMKGLCCLIENDDNREAPGLLDLCASAARDQLKDLCYLGPIRAYPARDIKIAELPRVNDAHGLLAWRMLFEDNALRERVNSWLKNGKLTSMYEIAVDHRVSLERTRDLVIKELGNKIFAQRSEVSAAKELDKFDEVVFALENWEDSSAINGVFDLVSSWVTSEATGTLFLRDLKSGKQVSSRDIGVGVSQLLPVVVQAMGSHDQIIAIEQPELHLHPALQADLGDVFIQSAMTRSNRFVLETHSEHMLLRILRRIRETMEDKVDANGLKIGPEDVSVVYIEPSSEGSRIIELPVTPDGDFAKPWPQGFFADRGQELF